MKSTVNYIMWRLVIGTHTYNVKISRTDTGFLAEFDRKSIPHLAANKISREMVKNHIKNHKQK